MVIRDTGNLVTPSPSGNELNEQNLVILEKPTIALEVKIAWEKGRLSYLRALDDQLVSGTHQVAVAGQNLECEAGKTN